MDEFGKLYNNPEITSIFERYNDEIFPTEPDSVYQNRAAKCSCCTVSNCVNYFLISAILYASLALCLHICTVSPVFSP